METRFTTRRLASLILPVLFSVVLFGSFADVTFVMKNGERIAGTFSYNHTDHYQLIVNGRERDFPSDDIAMVAFVAGDPSEREISMLPDSENPPELDRHTLVLRSGEAIRGKIYDFRDGTLIMDIRADDRRTYKFGDIARLYISAPGARAVFKASEPRSRTPDARIADQIQRGGVRRGGGGDVVAGQTRIRVEGNVAWTDTGILVNTNDQVRFTATGEVKIDAGNMAGPAGRAGASSREVYPVRNTAPGALIGRVGDGRPFAIGSNTEPIVMPASGTLFLGINDNHVPDNGGAFEVRVQRTVRQ
jgi:hypothetical protein